jgi:hypothetical protein
MKSYQRRQWVAVLDFSLPHVVSEFLIKALDAHYYIDARWWVTPDHTTVMMGSYGAILRKAPAIPSLKDAVAWVHLYAQELYATHLIAVTNGSLNTDPETDPLWNIYVHLPQ